MPKHRKADGHTPKAAAHALVDKFRSSHGRSARSGKALAAVVACTAAVAIGQPLIVGEGPSSALAPRGAHVQAAANAVVTLMPPPAPAADQASAAQAQGATAARPQAVTTSLHVDNEAQLTGYWCGPAATRIALSSQIENLPDQATLADALGTTTNGTDHISQIVDVLNKTLPGAQYVTREWNGRPITPDMTQQLWSDIVRNIDHGKAMVANIVAKPGNQPPGYPSGQTIYHYVTIIGYNAADKTVHIADPARFSGKAQYWLSLDQLASLIQPKGYTA